MLFAKLLLGLAVGCASAVVPILLAELAPSEKRGQMVTRNELMIVAGQFVAFLSNAILGTIWADELVEIIKLNSRSYITFGLCLPSATYVPFGLPMFLSHYPCSLRTTNVPFGLPMFSSNYLFP